MTGFSDFLRWEASTRDTLDVKKIYIDMADGDLAAGVALSEIIYWHLPNKQGQSKLKVKRRGHLWIAVPRWEWWERTRMSPRQSDRVIALLREIGIIETNRWKWNNTPTVHIRIVHEKFLELWNNLVKTPRLNPFLPNGEIGPFYETVKSRTLPNGEITHFTDPLNLVTETTPEITTETTTTTRRGRLTDEDMATVATAYEQNIGMITPMISDSLNDALDTYAVEWIVEAIGIAVDNNKRKWSYVAGILSNWATNGKDRKRETPPAPRPPVPEIVPLTDDELAEAMERQSFGGKL